MIPEPRKCHNCRFFQDGGFAASGWCTHPERGPLHDLVMVRRAELACRDHRDNDLWQPNVPYLALTVVHEYVSGIQ